jgi:hypothetical protein
MEDVAMILKDYQIDYDLNKSLGKKTMIKHQMFE